MTQGEILTYVSLYLVVGIVFTELYSRTWRSRGELVTGALYLFTTVAWLLIAIGALFWRLMRGTR